jgi:hypothetical protein
MSARENLLRKSCRAPADNHFIYISHRQHSCDKKDPYQRFLLRMRMKLYRPILGSPHFWLTDKARFLKEQRRCSEAWPPKTVSKSGFTPFCAPIALATEGVPPNKEDAWKPIRFLVGRWDGVAEGEAGRGTVKTIKLPPASRYVSKSCRDSSLSAPHPKVIVPRASGETLRRYVPTCDKR